MLRHDPHPSDEELVAFIDGELALAPQSAVGGHLQRCAPCRSRAAAMQTSLRRITEQLRAESVLEVEPGRVRLQQALRESPATPAMPQAFVSQQVHLRPWLQIAAILVVGAGIVLMGVSLLERDMPPWRAGVQAMRATQMTDLPLPSATPGAVSEHSAAELCNGARPSRLVPDTVRRHVLERYGMVKVPEAEYELDALITPELGGTTAAANLWPQRYDSPVWNARVKDELERLLPAMVCRGELDLASAQEAIARDWIGAYKKFFRTDAPLAARSAPLDVVDDDDLVLLPAALHQ